MINANELRLWNWISFHPNKEINKYCQVIAIDGMEIAVMGIVVLDKEKPLLSYFDPIPLTPEMLEKAGFVWDVLFGLWIKETETGEILLSKDYILQSTDTLTQLKYVHSLQNLIFALTGEELEINL